MISRITIVFFFFFITGYSNAQTEVIITNDNLIAGESYTWESDKTYILDGIVVVKSGSQLIIEAGTIIKGLADPILGADNGSVTSALLVARGAKIFAVGEPNNPIIFTSILDTPEGLSYQDRGLWGGVVICGAAPVGRFYGSPKLGQFPEDFPDDFGGEDPDDNSGIFQYVSIRHAGAAPVETEELNALTLAGVGRTTVIDHVEVFAGKDDGIGLIGGTVNLKYINAAFFEDDAYDIDLGWRGKGQFWLGILSEDSHTALESDGAQPDDYFLYSQPELYNMTFIGQGPNGLYQSSIYFRDGCGGTLSNNIFIEFPETGLEVEDRSADWGVDSRSRLEEGELQFLNNIWWAIGNKTTFSTGPNGILFAKADAEDPTAQFLVDHLINNQNTIENPDLARIDWTNSNLLDPRPALGGPAYQNLAAYPDDPFFTVVPFKGAFGQDASWLFSWSALDDYQIVSPSFSKVVTSTKEVIASPTEIQLFPNPIFDQVTLKTTDAFDESDVSIRIVDMLGRAISTQSTQLNPGASNILTTDDLLPGNYVLQVVGKERIYVLPFVKLER